MNNNLQSILEAAHYAAEKHANQRRKGAAAEPYVNHLIDVARMVSSAISEPDPNLIIAALLHDSVEDAGVTPAELAERFGLDVAGLVMEVTDDKSLPKAERKRLQVQTAPLKSPRAQIIKLADKISNVKSILQSPPADWDYARREQYFAWAKEVVAALSSPNPQLLAEFNRISRDFPQDA